MESYNEFIKRAEEQSDLWAPARAARREYLSLLAQTEEAKKVMDYEEKELNRKLNERSTDGKQWKYKY